MSADLVFLHGIGGSSLSWAPQEAAFSESHRVVCWNAPGFGGRALPEYISFASIAWQLADDLRDLGIERAVLVGHSFGGMVAQQMARDFPERVSALVLSGTSSAFGKPDGDFQRAFVAARLDPLERGETLADMADEMVESIVGKDADAEGVALAKQCMAQVPPETYRAVVRLIVTFDLREALGAIACPTLLIAAENDPNAPSAMMQRMAGRIPGARFRTIAGAGHLANLERPQAFNDILNAFLKECVT